MYLLAKDNISSPCTILFLIATVLEQHQTAKLSEVRIKMGQKCKDMRASQKRMAASDKTNEVVLDV